MTDLLGLPRSVKNLQNGADFSRKLEHRGPAEKEWAASVPQSEQLERTAKPLLPEEKGTELSLQITKS